MCLIVVMRLLKSLRDDNDLNLRHLDNTSDAVLLICCCTWLEELSQPGEIIPFLFHFINSYKHIYRIASLSWLLCRGHWHIPKCGMPAICYVSRLRFDEKKTTKPAMSEVSGDLSIDRLG